MSEIAHLPAPQGEQLELTGFPITRGRTRFALSNATDLTTDRELAYNDHVEVHGQGRVKGLQFREDKDGLKAIYLVEILDAELS